MISPRLRVPACRRKRAGCGGRQKGRAKMSKWIQKAVKHPGALKRAAERAGRTTEQEAEVESKSKNKKIAARGRLGERFIKHEI